MYHDFYVTGSFKPELWYCLWRNCKRMINSFTLQTILLHERKYYLVDKTTELNIYGYFIELF